MDLIGLGQHAAPQVSLKKMRKQHSNQPLALDISLEPELVLLSDLNLDLVATAATACARLTVPNANSSLPSKGWSLFKQAGAVHRALTSALGALLRDAAARADEDMRLPEVHEQSGAVIGLTQPQQACCCPFACLQQLIPLSCCHSHRPAFAHQHAFHQGGVKTSMPSPPLLPGQEAPPSLISRKVPEMVKPSSAALKAGRTTSTDAPELQKQPPNLPGGSSLGLRRELGKRAKGGETRRGGEMENEDAALCSS